MFFTLTVHIQQKIGYEVGSTMIFYNRLNFRANSNKVKQIFLAGNCFLP